MKIKILKEIGYAEALYGLSLSYNTKNDIVSIARKLCQKDGGHNKFLESIILWISIDAPRYWWSQFDTYRIGVTKQSESTMHTLMKRELIIEDFEDIINRDILNIINTNIRTKDFNAAKAHLPESFLQERVICTNYKTLRNIIFQRKNHRLKQWNLFIDYLYKNVMHPEFLPTFKIKEYNDKNN